YKDFGVTELIAIGLPISIRLGLTAMALAIIVGGLAGILAALRQNRFLDHAVMALAMTGIAVPSFVTAPILALVFGLYLRWLPVAGWNDGAPANMVLPVIALALPQIAIIARLTRGGMLEVLRSNFVRTARARGIPESRVVLRHVLPSAVIPLVGYLGPAIAGVMTGSLVIELIFNLPGVGRYFVQGALNRDYPLVMGIVVIYASFIVTLNLLADLAYAALDPRIRRGYR
ncbi:MAG: ABC transporter permease subunit, partial [Gammaproteobacteria bacterium]|nr:ABC transporter permease subunit [Gammaproteobacteria bacterium]